MLGRSWSSLRGAAAVAAARWPQRALHADASPASVLTREYIYGALYARESGYFATRHVLHAPPAPLAFGELWGEREYRTRVAELYRADTEAWLTPVEVFAPHYSRALARYMLSSPFCPPDGRLAVYEIGGGAGTNALHILDYLKVCVCVCAAVIVGSSQLKRLR